MPPYAQDAIFTFRQLRRNPAFAFTSIVSLALGIGATTAVFSVVYAVLLNPYPYRDADQLTYFVLRDKAGTDRWPGLSFSQVRRLRQLDSIESVVPMNEWNLTTTDSDLPEDVVAWYLSPNATTHLGVPALLGRGLIASDAPEGQEPQPVVVIGYKFWQTRYGGSADVIGQRLQLVHKTYTIVGVMPPRFTWQGADIYLPLKFVDEPGRAYFCSLRLKPGVTRERANAELQPLAEQFAKEIPARYPPSFRMRIQGLNDWFVDNLGGTLALLFGGVTLMLLIGCGNVSILLLARGAARQQELAVRTAIGAKRGRIVRQLLTESLGLSLCGALAGVGLASLLIRVILKWMPPDIFPSEAAIRIDPTVLLFSVALALLTGILFGLWPAFRLSRPDLAALIQAASRRMTGGAHGQRTHAILVAGQVALTLVLLTGAGQASAAFVRMMNMRLGYDPAHTMSVGIPVHDGSHMQWEDRAQYFEQIRAKIAEMPCVTGAGISTNATPPSNGMDARFQLFGQSEIPEQQARTNFVSPEYFTVLHIPLVSGRMWTHAETIRGARLALVNQTFAHQYWPKGNAVGQQIRVPQLKAQLPYNTAAPESDGWLQIIGVVADARDDGLRKPIRPGLYVPYAISMRMFTQILVRTRGEPLALLREVRREVRSVDADQQIIGDPRNLEQWIERQPEFAGERLVTILLSGFSLMALALAAAGLYSVVSHGVARRTNEFGIRMALGARPGDVIRLVFASTASSVGAGLAAGVVASLVLARVLASWTQETSRDPLILAAVIVVLAAAAAAACLLPARRASSIDPMIALRYE